MELPLDSTTTVLGRTFGVYYCSKQDQAIVVEPETKRFTIIDGNPIGGRVFAAARRIIAEEKREEATELEREAHSVEELALTPYIRD